MTISHNIRILEREGLSTAEIARRLGIRYQHAYKVLKADGQLVAMPATTSTTIDSSPRTLARQKPLLTVSELAAGGFTLSSRWVLSSTGDLALDRPLPGVVGVYAFAKGDIVLYVGVATMGLAKRVYFYGRPGVTQRTSLRLNGIIRNELLSVPCIDIYTAVPPDLEWNCLPIHGSAGLELGLIKKFALPWNMRSAK
jgi:hypothetical protein